MFSKLYKPFQNLVSELFLPIQRFYTPLSNVFVATFEFQLISNSTPSQNNRIDEKTNPFP